MIQVNSLESESTINFFSVLRRVLRPPGSPCLLRLSPHSCLLVLLYAGYYALLQRPLSLPSTAQCFILAVPVTTLLCPRGAAVLSFSLRASNLSYIPSSALDRATRTPLTAMSLRLLSFLLDTGYLPYSQRSALLAQLSTEQRLLLLLLCPRCC